MSIRTRARSGRGFRYLTTAGKVLQNRRHLQRIEDLVIPPAWSDVWICRQPRGHLQCTGRDERSRKQYLYHSKWREIANRAKFANLVQMGEVLPRIRRRVVRDLRQSEWSIDKACAVAVRILDETAIRVGSREYTRDNHSYGLTTLQPEHLTIEKSWIQLEFTGKSGKPRQFRFRNSHLATLLGELVRLGGETLLSVPEADQWRSLTATDVNHYLQRVSRAHVTAKDFRTWRASTIAAEHLLLCSKQQMVARRAISQAIRAAADELGNTTTVCRKYYVYPPILNAYESGQLAPLCTNFTPGRQRAFSQPEQRLLWLLRAFDEEATE